MRGNQERCQKKSRRREEPREKRLTWSEQRDGLKIPGDSRMDGEDLRCEEKRAFLGVDRIPYIPEKERMPRRLLIAKAGFLCLQVQSGHHRFTIDAHTLLCFSVQFPHLRLIGFLEHEAHSTCTSPIWEPTMFLSLHPPPSLGRSGNVRASRPSHPVIPRLLGFSWLCIVPVQCFPT